MIAWLGDGPGCSALNAFFQSQGPYLVASSPNDTHLFTKNEYSWNTKANMLYLEAPAGIGFSYCNETLLHRDCAFDDLSSAEDNL